MRQSVLPLPTSMFLFAGLLMFVTSDNTYYVKYRTQVKGQTTKSPQPERFSHHLLPSCCFGLPPACVPEKIVNVVMTSLAGHVQRRPLIQVDVVDIGIGADQQANSFQMPAFGGQHQRG